MTDHPDTYDVDQDEGMSADERHEADRTAEFVLDAQDEERAAEEQRKAEADAPEVDNGECWAEFIDGSYTSCGCDECNEREAAEDECRAEDERHPF